MGNFQRVVKLLAFLTRQRHLMAMLVKEDLKARYLGSFLGVLWAFIQPTVTIGVLWFITEVGFKSQPINQVPFIFWLLGAMIPWFFLSDALANGTGAILEKPFLVKKIAFPTHLLPFVKVVSAAILHGFFIALTIVIIWVWGYGHHIQIFQIFYYFLAAILFLIGLTWVTSSLVVFYRDLSQIVGILLQVGFWVTPIFWSLQMVPLRYHFWLKLNPLLYVTDGYRESLIGSQWFWEKPLQTFYFWIWALGLLWLGSAIFRRIRPHFPDVI